MCPDALHLSRDVRVEVAESAELGVAGLARLELETGSERLIRETVQAASGMAQDEDLVRSQHVAAQQQRSDRVLGRHSARVAHDVRVARSKTEDVLDNHPRVHARQDCDAGQRRRSQARAIQLIGVALVLREQPPELVRQ
jgi:hypothetical protein